MSTLWNAWLGYTVPPNVREQELIVGGELDLGEAAYVRRLGDSISACIRMTKRNRWISIVFQHWNVGYFKAILSSAADSGAELKAAVSQVGDPIWSMHKKKRRRSVLAGEMILTFLKTGTPKELRVDRPFDIGRSLDAILAGCGDTVYGELIFNKLVIGAWENSAIDSLNVSKTEFVELMEQRRWGYDEKNHFWVKERATSDLLF